MVNHSWADEVFKKNFVIPDFLYCADRVTTSTLNKSERRELLLDEEAVLNRLDTKMTNAFAVCSKRSEKSAYMRDAAYGAIGRGTCHGLQLVDWFRDLC
jgi:glutamate dehydrogenase/leucine dehydrogenase